LTAEPIGAAHCTAAETFCVLSPWPPGAAPERISLRANPGAVSPETHI
jgi:hypothetical protein